MGFLSDLLKDYPALNVAQERVALAEAKYAALEEENKRLKGENAQLKGELAAAQRQIPSDDFVERRGVLFKRRADGKFDPDAYCPKCKTPLYAMDDIFIPTCSGCRFRSPIKRPEMRVIVGELNSGV